MTNNNLLTILDCRDELTRVMEGQYKVLSYMKENSLIPEHDEKTPLVIDNANLPEMQKVLEGEAYKLKNFDVVISVVGTMKAGKSTTINAIVGKEVLPNRNRPMTTLPTLICHEKGRKTPVLKLDATKINQLIYDLNLALQKEPGILNFPDIQTLSQDSSSDVITNIQACTKFKSEIEGSEAIFEELEYLNDLARVLGIVESTGQIKPETSKNFYDAYKEVNALPTIFIEFESLKDLSGDSEGRLMLLDTPGPNEANQPELKNILEQQLKRSSAVILVLDYTQLKSEAEHNVREQIEKIPTIQKDRLYVVVNKFDQHTSNSDDREKTISIVSNDLLKNKIEYYNVFPMSAKDAFFARRMLGHILITGEKPSVEEGWVQDFFGSYKTAEKRLSRDELKYIKEDAEDVLESSYIEELLEKVINKAFIEAPKIAIDSAIANSKKIFEDLFNVFAIDGYFANKVKMSEEELEKIEKTVKKLEENQLELKKSGDAALEEINKLANSTSEEVLKKIEHLSEIISNDIKGLDAEWLKEYKRREQQAKEDNAKFFKFRTLREMRELRNKKASLDEISKCTTTELRFADMNDMKEYEKSIESCYRTLVEEANENVSVIINTSILNISKYLGSFEAKYLNEVKSIQQEFSNSDIQLVINLPDIEDFINVVFGERIIFNEMRSYQSKEYLSDRDSLAGGVKRFFGGVFGKKDWGRDTVKYIKYDNQKLLDALTIHFIENIIDPLKNQSYAIVEKYGRETISIYTNEIEKQTQALINQLVAAIEAEKAPEETLRIRKDHLNVAIRMNQSIVGAMSQIETAKSALFPVQAPLLVKDN
ncbi:Hypothetical protein F387_00288 [Wohlfahrtiimonas chitiniclastica SH04]|uniref:Dynamin-type G domain-containing protein n=1 Tax=Wohlfahrtiimonas chitiniclastica SH04 TaxID=1261130 RepID=L8Y1R9_9GAMM|nr:dynamin family protein [Wohlfahrtiimonas chitiniclastica]ELV08895.1 Hypothetical protein F387_00288 [Wohlfahrtiimonas chitiniclastica SH04]